MARLLGLESLAERHPRSLSTGERQRVAIAAVAVGGAPVLLLDEPTRGMDAPSQRTRTRGQRPRGAGGAVVLATHDVETRGPLRTRVVVLGDGDVVADGPARACCRAHLFAPQVLRVLPPFLTVGEVEAALADGSRLSAPGGPMTAIAVPAAVRADRAGLRLVVIVGAAAFLYPFWLAERRAPEPGPRRRRAARAALVGLLASPRSRSRCAAAR